MTTKPIQPPGNRRARPADLSMGGVIHTVTNVLHVLDPQLLALVLLSATWAWSDREDRSRQHEASMALIQSCMNASAPAVPFERLRTRLDN